MKKLNFFQSGFSIMEVMIAAGLLGVVTVGVMQVTKNMTKSSKSDALRVEFNALTSQMQSILRDEYSCEATLSGFSPSGSGTAITQLKRKRTDGTESVVFQTGQSYGATTAPIFLKSMAIKNYDAASGIGDFEIKMNKGRKDYDSMTQTEKDTVLATSYGTAIVAKILKLQLILDGSGKIKDCLSDKDDYTAGACGMINGDWADKVKCKSINVFDNGLEPAITSEGYLAAKKGFTVGSALATDPGDGSINVADKATVANDTTITAGKLIFNNNDARINPVAGSNLYFENKAGTAGANIIAGISGASRTTVTPTSVTINKNGTIGAGLALEVIGNTTLTGSGSTTVTLKVGNADIQYNGTNLVLNKPAGGVIQYKDGSTIEEVASQGFVNAQLGRALTGDAATLTSLLSNLSTLVSGSPVQSIAATTCGFYTNMTWNGTRCVDNRTTNCSGNQMVKGFNSGAINCQPAVGVNQSCSAGQIYTGHDSNGNKMCANADVQIGNYVDSKIDAALFPISANSTCAAKGGWLSNNNNTCNYNQSCTYSRTIDVGCHACPNTGAPGCNAAPSGYYVGIGSCGTWNSSCQVGCRYDSYPGNQSCTCPISADGLTCGGASCSGCS